jgi:hypothetical protein
MGDKLNLNDRASHSRLIQLLREIESRLEPGIAYCSSDEFQQWADENRVGDDEGLWDTLAAAERYCNLDAHLFQIIGIPLNRIGRGALELLNATEDIDDSKAKAWNVIEVYETLRQLYDFARGYRVELEYKASDGNMAPQVNYNGQAFSATGKPPSNEPDGPVIGYFWRYNGRTTKPMQPGPWKLADFLWHSRLRTATFDQLAEPLKGDKADAVTTDSVRSHCKRANQFFEREQIPLVISIKAETVSLESIPAARL